MKWICTLTNCGRFGTRIKLVGQPFEILSMLPRCAGELVTRDEMRSRLWPSDTFVDFNHGLNAAVNKLRWRVPVHGGEEKSSSSRTSRLMGKLASLQKRASFLWARRLDTKPP